MRRRTLLRLMGAAAAWVRMPAVAAAQGVVVAPADEARLRALADVVLPGELSAAARGEVVDAFLRWIRNYREGAEMDHGYGVTRLRRTPASPARGYAAQLAALDRAARAKGAAFELLDIASRRAVVETAVDAAKIDRLPFRPAGGHVAVDLMAFYFHSPAANDLAYHAEIRRDSCRGLPGSEQVPTPVRPRSDQGQTGVGTGSDQGQSQSTGRLKVAGRAT